MKLDVGCGIYCRDGFTGVDRKKWNNKVKYIIDLEKDKLPFRDNSIDEIICFACLEHVNNPADVIREFFRILKKRKKAVILVPYFRHYTAYNPEHKNYWSSYSAYTLGEYFESEKWANIKVDFQWHDNFFGNIQKIIFSKMNKSIYEKYFSYLFPAVMLKLEMIK